MRDSSETETIVVPKILSILHTKSITALQYFSIGEILDKNIFAPDHSDITFDLKIAKEPILFMKEATEEFSTCFKVGTDEIYYEKKYAGMKCKMLIQNINSNRINVYINRTYLNFVKFRIDSLYPVGIHLMDLFLVNTIKKGDLVVHGASLYNPATKDSFLIIAPPDTGKTYSTLKLLEMDYKFLGEDLSYYQKSSDSLICVPFTSTWGHHFPKKGFDVTRVPILSWFFTARKSIVTDLFGINALIERAPLARIYLIEKADRNSVSKLDQSEEFLSKVMIIQRNEFTYFKNMLIRAFEYQNRTDIDGVMQKEKDSFIELLKTKPLYLVKGTHHSEFHRLIHENESKLER